MKDFRFIYAFTGDNFGRHICRGLRGNNPPTIRNYCAHLCSSCGGRHAVELPEDGETELLLGKNGEVRDKRRFAHYLDLV